jgi:signal transduction histidine kinase
VDIQLRKESPTDSGLLNRSILSLVLVSVISVTSLYYANQVEQEAEKSRLLAEKIKYERVAQTELQHLIDLIYRSSSRTYSPNTPAIVNSFPWVRGIGIVGTGDLVDQSVKHQLLTLSLAEVSRSLGGQITFATVNNNDVLLVLSRADETHTTRAIFSATELTKFINGRVNQEDLGIDVNVFVGDADEGDLSTPANVHLGMPGLEFDAFLRDHSPNKHGPKGITSLAWLLIGTLWLVWLLLFLERRRRLRQKILLSEQKQRIENQAERAVLAEITSSIGHEINQPMAAIETLSDTASLMLDSGNYGDASKTLRQIQAESLRVGQIIQTIRRLSSTKGLVLEPIDLIAVIRELAPLVKIICKEARFSLNIQVEQDQLIILAERTAIEQIIINLIANSHEAIIGSKKRKKQSSWIELSLSVIDGYASVKVRDNGPGVSEGLEAEIFNSFVTTKSDGVGLGLNLSRSIAEKHLGWLKLVESGIHGSVFELRLPTDQSKNMGL